MIISPSQIPSYYLDFISVSKTTKTFPRHRVLFVTMIELSALLPLPVKLDISGASGLRNCLSDLTGSTNKKHYNLQILRGLIFCNLKFMVPVKVPMKLFSVTSGVSVIHDCCEFLDIFCIQEIFLLSSRVFYFFCHPSKIFWVLDRFQEPKNICYLSVYVRMGNEITFIWTRLISPVQ